MANAGARERFERDLREHAPLVEIRLLEGRAHEAMAASDAVLVASGTATLETALLKRPMVVAYRVAALTGWLLREMKLVKAEYFSHPNLLAGRPLVPEFFQGQVRPEVLGPALLEQLDRPDRAALIDEYGRIHQMLRCDASQRAADAVLELVAGRQAAR
jgi:lipid-A-disaccharide synthase